MQEAQGPGTGLIACRINRIIMNNIYILLYYWVCATFEGVSSQLCPRGSRRSPDTETKEVLAGYERGLAGC